MTGLEVFAYRNLAASAARVKFNWTPMLHVTHRGDINVFYLVRPGPSSFAFFSRKKVGSRKFFGPKGQKFFFRGKYTL